MGKKALTDKGYKGTLKSYSLWFLIAAAICILPFYTFSRRHFFGGDDGVYQQYIYFLYVGKWIRAFAHNIFVAHSFEMPMWDMSIGPGGDPLITLSGSVNPLTDPLCWISCFVPVRAAEYVFDVVILIKFYLTGLAFTRFSHDRGLKTGACVTGALVYTFSSMTYIGFYQVFFLNAFIFFPLLMDGACALWEKKKHMMYVIVLALCAAYSFYFTYMMMLLLIIYCVIRFICELKTSSQKLLPLILRYVVWSLAGIAIGIGAQIPSMFNLATLDRVKSGSKVGLFAFDKITLFFNPFSYINTGTDCFWGCASIALLALILLFTRKNEGKLLKIVFAVYSVSFLIPAAGSVFNGFNTASMRYIFGYALLLAYIVALNFERLSEIKGKKILMVTGGTALFLAVTFAITRDMGSIVSAVSLIVVTGAVVFINKKGLHREMLLQATALLSCFILSIYAFAGNIAETACSYGNAYDKMFASPSDVFSDDVRGLEGRYDRLPLAYSDVPVNSSMITGVYGLDSYNSNCNGNVDNYYLDLGVVSDPFGVFQCGLRGRNYLELLNGTSALSVYEASPKAVGAPYAYEAVRSEGDFTLYRNEDAAMAFFYDDLASYSQYEALDPMGREELMMNACVVEDAPDLTWERGYDEIECTLSDSTGIEFTDDTHFTVQEDGYLVFDIDPVSSREISVLVSNVHSDEMYMIVPMLMAGDENVKVDFYVGTSDTDIYYHWKDTVLFNMGFVEGEVDSVKIRFAVPGNYSLGDIKIYTRSEEQLDNTISSFLETADAGNVTYSYDGCNSIKITATSEGDRYLYIAVPYSEGWRATEGGKELTITRANQAFMMIPVSAGEHVIELHYRTPYLIQGTVLSAVSLTAFIAYEIVTGKRKEKKS